MSEHKQSDSTLDLFAQVEDNPPAIRQAHGDPL